MMGSGTSILGCNDVVSCVDGFTNMKHSDVDVVVDVGVVLLLFALLLESIE